LRLWLRPLVTVLLRGSGLVFFVRLSQRRPSRLLGPVLCDFLIGNVRRVLRGSRWRPVVSSEVIEKIFNRADTGWPNCRSGCLRDVPHTHIPICPIPSSLFRDLAHVVLSVHCAIQRTRRITCPASSLSDDAMSRSDTSGRQPCGGKNWPEYK